MKCYVCYVNLKNLSLTNACTRGALNLMAHDSHFCVYVHCASILQKALFGQLSYRKSFFGQKRIKPQLQIWDMVNLAAFNVEDHTINFQLHQ
jgi:hypothetical protein